MKEITGKYNTAKIFAQTIDDSAAEQIKTLCDQLFVKGQKIRIMPDVHAGAGCTIGTTMTISDKIVPNLVGVDIGCGMAVYVLENQKVDFEKLDTFIRREIPSGMNIRAYPHKFTEKINLEELKCREHINLERAIHSLGTLGGGNHFIEVDKDDDGFLHLVLHSGSRYLGKQVAEHYQTAAAKALTAKTAEKIPALIKQLKDEGRASEIKAQTKTLKHLLGGDVPKSLAFVEGELFDDYLHDMKLVQQYAVYNRKAMAEDIISALNLTVKEHFTTIHNYIDTEAMILRKGAVSARAGEKILIPVNMRDGSLICVGKGNPDWNFSAPHGAGRLFSRSQARKAFNLTDFARTMNGIYTTSINEDTLDECPMAYKNMDEIVACIKPTADIIKIIKPVYNFKAGETARQ